MKIKYRTAMTGDRFTRRPGEVADVSDAKGKRLIEAGFAEKIEPAGDGSEKTGGEKTGDKGKK